MLLRRFRGQGGAPRMLNIAFRLQRFQLGRKKRACADAGLQFLKSFSKIGSLIFQDPIDNKT